MSHTSPPSQPSLRAAPLRVMRRLTLPLKTTIILLTLLMGVVALSGMCFVQTARVMLQHNKSQQVDQFAYAVSSILGERSADDPFLLQRELDSLAQTPNLEFAVLTDPKLNEIASAVRSRDTWKDYRRILGSSDTWMSNGVGVGHPTSHGNHLSYVVTVPVFKLTGQSKNGPIYGYLHVASSADSDTAQIHFLEVFALLTCMGVVLIAVPVANAIARHITVPIQRLATAAHALAAGDRSHRVHLKRSDELGELTLAFNQMADTVQAQQDDIKRINAGLEQKIQERTAELEKVNRRLTAEMAEKEDFLRAVSHDLNAPLRNIAGMTSMLILKYQDTLGKDALQRLDRIQKNVEVESELINEILELSRIKSRREKIERIHLGDLIDAVSEGFSADLESRKITLRTTGQFPIMHCEKARLRQVFQNLIDNSIKYMRDDSAREILLGVEWSQDELHFTVIDTGIGIAQEEIPYLFNVFRRAKNASVMKIPGKGVGLTCVKSIIENYHGRLWVVSVPGKGTTFHFAIPKNHFEVPQEVTV